MARNSQPRPSVGLLRWRLPLLLAAHSLATSAAAAQACFAQVSRYASREFSLHPLWRQKSREG